ncbi:response regulator [Ectobacillus ponti]|uniref:Response regulator transcription factor n=1 Tax=Ectobacillus ponti TaxID=2961894 RepID=A0AA41X6C6_9BACI|nr:response regulator transcription factor [Ectobacillus ponti]MCP8969617.1 response regulator transcription factor [Ectobacillus ponti]
MIRVLIADDHHMVRRGLAFFLGTQPDITIVGEAADGKQAVQLAGELVPDMILMDLVMPGMDGIQATKLIKQQHPGIKIMMLTSFSDQEHVIPALEAGASGYQLKDIEPDELARCIRNVCAGTNEMHPKATTHLLQQFSGSRLLNELTKRELEVLREIANGKSNKEIADALVITERTVKTHVSHILAKLDLADRTQAALFAVRHHLV